MSGLEIVVAVVIVAVVVGLCESAPGGFFNSPTIHVGRRGRRFR